MMIFIMLMKYINKITKDGVIAINDKVFFWGE